LMALCIEYLFQSFKQIRDKITSKLSRYPYKSKKKQAKSNTQC
jgi:hypothetical protein